MPRDQLERSTAVRKGGPVRPASSVRTTTGCLTCRARRKKCPNQMGDGECDECLRLNIECLGYSKKRPTWLIAKMKTVRETLKLSKQLRDLEADHRALRAFYESEGWAPNHGTLAPASTPEVDVESVTMRATPTTIASVSPPDSTPETERVDILTMPFDIDIEAFFINNGLVSGDEIYGFSSLFGPELE